MAAMGHDCCPAPTPPTDISYRRVLWIALFANLAMFAVELVASVWSGSSALAADAADFLGDSANYALSLGALAIGGAWISRVALLKGVAMSFYGIGVLAYAAWRAWLGVPPEPLTMGVVGALALAVNFSVGALLYRFREGDANMRSVWLCSRNDALGNLAVLAAALGVFGTGTAWPDLAVAAIMAGLALSAAFVVLRQASREAAPMRQLQGR
jgi:Co/Zn/Cd efflux system component